MRLLHAATLAQRGDAEQLAYQRAQAVAFLSLGSNQKQAGDAVPVYAMYGKLYLSKSGWLLLQVPNALGRGAFDALQEPGVEMPDGADYNAHVSVMRKEEVAQIGGDKISERGHSFAYTLGPVKTVSPKTWDGVSKVWYITIRSPELEALRKSYGLTPKPNGDWDFHLTFATRRTHVLRNNETSKAAAAIPVVRPERRNGKGQFGFRHGQALSSLLTAKSESDRKNYPAKHKIIRNLLQSLPNEFKRDSDQGHTVGLTHTPTNFKIHAPKSVLS